MSVARLLVTGANGFIGRALIRAASERAIVLRAAVRDEMRLAGLPADLERVCVGDLSPATDWSAALDGCDVVVHLANLAHAAVGEVALQEVNVDATLGLAEQAARRGVRRMVFVSSVKALGEASAGRALREDDPAHPSDAYGRAKRAAEVALWGLAQRRGLEVTILRPPLVYGAGVRANFRALMRAVLRGVPLPFASIDNRRSLVFVGNLCDALIACAAHPQAAGRTYHVTDGAPSSTPMLVRSIGAALGRPARLFACPPALLEWLGSSVGRGETARRLTRSLEIDDSRIRAELGWHPRFSMQEGLRETAHRLERPCVPDG